MPKLTKLQDSDLGQRTDRAADLERLLRIRKEQANTPVDSPGEPDGGTDRHEATRESSGRVLPATQRQRP